MRDFFDVRPAGTDDIVFDLGLSARRSRTVLSVIGRRSELPAGLFPEVRLVSRNHAADARLLLAPQSRASAGPLPVFRVSHGFLRIPPIRHRSRSFFSATLSRETSARSISWPMAIAASDDWYTPPLAQRAETVLQQLRSARIGSAWWLPALRQPRSHRAVVFAAAAPDPTLRLLEAALARFGAGSVILVSPRHRQIAAAAKRRGIMVLTGPVNMWGLIESADCVFAPEASEAVFLAQLLGRDVYGGRAKARDPARLLAATLLLGTRYVDPFTRHSATCEHFLTPL